MFYRNPNLAFLFEAVIGLLSLLTILTFGETGFLVIGLFSFRPLLFRKDRLHPADEALVRYAHIFRRSVLLTVGFLVNLVVAQTMGFLVDLSLLELVLIAFPVYMTVHGLTGLLSPEEGEGHGEGGSPGPNPG